VLVYEAAGANEEVVIARKGIGTFFLDITGKGLSTLVTTY